MHAPDIIIINNFEKMKESGNVFIDEIEYGTEECKLYTYLTQSSANNKKIGDGEAAAIALVKCNNGVLASNNMRDISYYIDEYGLKHTTTADILIEALEEGIISNNNNHNHNHNILNKYILSLFIKIINRRIGMTINVIPITLVRLFRINLLRF